MKKALIVSFVMMGFGASALAGVSSQVEAAAKGMGAAKVTEVTFDTGATQVTDGMKEEVKKAIEEARGAGKVKEVRLVVWADREYPADGTKASPQDVTLADSRGEQLQAYLKNDLKVGKVTAFNMAKRPNTIQKWFGTKTAETKGGIEATGGAPKTDAETGILNQNAQASKAVLMIYQ